MIFVMKKTRRIFQISYIIHQWQGFILLIIMLFPSLVFSNKIKEKETIRDINRPLWGNPPAWSVR